MRRLQLPICLILFAASAAFAQDAAKVAPGTHKVVLDNDRVRVLDIRVPAGGKIPMHSHPDYVAYAVNDYKVKFTFPDGKTAEVIGKAGDATWRKAETHASENIGTAELHVLNIELKEAPGNASPAKK